MTQYILLALIAINCVLIGINWRLMYRLKQTRQDAIDVMTNLPSVHESYYRDALYVRGINVSDQFK